MIRTISPSASPSGPARPSPTEHTEHTEEAFQRIWRASSVAARHAVVLPMVGYEVYGKALLGREDPITPLV